VNLTGCGISYRCLEDMLSSASYLQAPCTVAQQQQQQQQQQAAGGKEQRAVSRGKDIALMTL
jgi:hypothetical protein